MAIRNWMEDIIVPILILMLLSSMFLSTEAAIDKASIVGIWLFDEGSGNKVKDSSDNGNHGNLVNKPEWDNDGNCLLYTSPSPRDATLARMPSSA